MPLTPETDEKLRTLYRALDLQALPPGDGFYVESVNQRPDSDIVADLSREIDWQEGGGVCLVTGQRGTGKSTELLRLQKMLEERGASVFYADLFEFLLMTKEVEISDFLISVAGAFSERIEERYRETPGRRGYWERLSDFLDTEVEIDSVSAKIGPGTIKASLKNDPYFKERLQKAARGHVAKLVQQAHEFVAEAVAFVREKEGDENHKVVLIVDSVERIRGVGREAMDVYESVRELFLAQAENLRLPSLHVVYSIPPYLSVLAAGAGGLLGGGVPKRFVSVHVFKHQSRDPDPDGLAIMREVISKRYANWRELIEEKALDRLALRSGGDLREFFRLLGPCLTGVRDDGQLPLDEEAVKAVENTARSEMLPIPREHLDWLKRIAASHDSCLERDADVPTLAHFLDNRLVLVYRNGQDWYDVHPLLRDVVDEHEPSDG